MKEFYQRASQRIDDFFEKFSKDNTFSMAAALAFYAVLSIAPLLILFLALAAQFNFSIQSSFAEQVKNLIGNQAAEVVQMIILAAKDRDDLKGLSGLFGILTLAFSSSAVFVELKSSLNLILNSSLPEKSSVTYMHWGIRFIKDRILNIGLAISFLFILMISLILTTVINLYVSSYGHSIVQVLSLCISFFIQFFLFSFLYRYVPDRNENWRISFVSGIITTALFVIRKEAVGYYLGRSAVGSTYGAAGSVIVLLIWIYYTALIVFSGAQISHLVTTQKETGSCQK